MLVVFVHKVDLDFIQSLIETLENQMVPIGTQAQELPEVAHVVFQYRHRDPWLQHAIGATELNFPFRLARPNSRKLTHYLPAPIGILGRKVRIRILHSRVSNYFDLIGILLKKIIAFQVSLRILMHSLCMIISVSVIFDNTLRSWTRCHHHFAVSLFGSLI